MAEHVDVLVIGAGLAGVAAGVYLQREHPGRRYAIVEARDAIGGTWDLFRYPGVRSDSDMYTLGYRFRPWTGGAALADGASILAYVRATAREAGVDRQVRFGHRVVGAAWSSAAARWTVTIARAATGDTLELTCDFVIACSGYYAYDAGYTPALPGLERFGGQVVHPQRWGDTAVAGRRVVVLGSGATAVTLVPALARDAAHVTMLQRSPTYVVSRPAIDPLAARLARWPTAAGYHAVRWKNIALGAASYAACRAWPGATRRLLEAGVRAQLPPGFDVDTHFHPRYAPWDQRLCLVPDGDLFAALSSGKASVVTDEIAGFAADALELRSGRTLPADLLVTATGLRVQLFGGARLTVDGRAVELGETHVYKGTMLEGVPNLALVVGYTNASWTLKCELSLAYVCRLLRHLDRHGLRVATPMARGPIGDAPLLDLRSGYVARAAGQVPRQGARTPWRLHQNYLRDLALLRARPIDDGALRLA
ncbi:MAG: NAD(P)/FAD-dependent oxidoreductase [Kofleriaceae bacterium]